MASSSTTALKGKITCGNAAAADAAVAARKCCVEVLRPRADDGEVIQPLAGEGEALRHRADAGKVVST